MLNATHTKVSAVMAACGLLLALAVLMQIPAFGFSSGRQVFNIADYGAKKDASLLATEAFRLASHL
jgi:hypothetical protein